MSTPKPNQAQLERAREIANRMLERADILCSIESRFERIKAVQSEFTKIVTSLLAEASAPPNLNAAADICAEMAREADKKATRAGAPARDARLFEARLLGFSEKDRIRLCEPCLKQAMTDNFVIFSSALPALPAETKEKSEETGEQEMSPGCLKLIGTRNEPATAGRRYSGELWLDLDGTANFKWHIEGGDFLSAREVLVKFIACLQSRLDSEQKCPFYESRESSI